MTLPPGQRAALRNLCTILNVPPLSTTPASHAALSLLNLTYGLPIIKSRHRTREAGNEILQATQPHFNNWAPLSGRSDDRSR